MTTPPLRRSTSIKSVDLPFAIGPVDELMRQLMKAVRAQQLYLPNNPMYSTAMDGLRAGFDAVWKETDELVLVIGETEVKWAGVPVLSEPAKSSDNLAWLFFKDGIRELRFARGLTDEEIARFLEIVTRARKATVDDDDLITMLWEADLSGISYQHVDVQAEEGTAGEETDRFAELARGGSEPATADDVRASTEEAAAEAQRPGVVNMADFDGTLYFLDAKEIDYLRQELAQEYAQDLRVNIVSALLDVFEQQEHEGVREEVLDHVETMLAFMLASGSFSGVAFLLREMATTATRTPGLPAPLRARIGTFADRLSAPDAIGQLLEALDDSPSLPPRNELAELFDQLRPAALSTVFSWLPRVRAEPLRVLVTDVADRLAAGNTAEIVKLIESSDVNVSNEAMRRAGVLKAQGAVAPLSRTVSNPEPLRRQIAVQALASIGSAGALQALERCVTDSDRDVRIIAARALAALGHRPGLGRLEPIVLGRDIRSADVTEKMAFFESYGSLCGDAGIPNLDGILNGKGFLGNREDPELRGAAAAGLGRIGTTKARDALQRAASDKEAVVRNAVARALRGADA